MEYMLMKTSFVSIFQNKKQYPSYFIIGIKWRKYGY